jgi:hypothetical protein
MVTRTTASILLAALALGAVAGPRLAGAQWVDQQSAGAFQIRSEFSLADEEGRRLISEISRLQTDVESLLAIKASDETIQINLFRSASSYRSHLTQRVPEAASRPALFVKGADMARVYVYRRRDFATDVRHECTHAVLHNALPCRPPRLRQPLSPQSAAIDLLRLETEPRTARGADRSGPYGRGRISRELGLGALHVAWA